MLPTALPWRAQHAQHSMTWEGGGGEKHGSMHIVEGEQVYVTGGSKYCWRRAGRRAGGWAGERWVGGAGGLHVTCEALLSGRFI